MRTDEEVLELRISLRQLPEAKLSRTLGAMEVHFTPEQEAQLAQAAGSVLEKMRALRTRVKPDPDGWTTRDYVRHGRR